MNVHFACFFCFTHVSLAHFDLSFSFYFFRQVRKKTMKKIVFVSFACLAFFQDVTCDVSQNFILTKKARKKVKKMSKNALKENIGQAARDAFYVTTNMVQQIGLAQISFAQVGDKFLIGQEPEKDVKDTLESDSPKLAMQAKNKSKQAHGKKVGLDKKLLSITSAVQKNIGYVHIGISQVQKKLSGIIEKLIDNRKPFKKASRAELTRVYKLLVNTYGDLKTRVRAWENVKMRAQKLQAQSSLPDINPVNNIRLLICEWRSGIKKLQETLDHDECLKKI